jgi:hypothetical protein
MNQYMVEIALPEQFTKDFVRLIPEQRALVNQLFEAGSLRAYSLSLDRAQLWTVVLAPSPEEALDIIDTFPIMPYCSSDIHELMFHDTATQELPRISLN